jgi:hypothetical protein
MAVATLDGAIQRVTPWNAAFKTLSVFLTANNFGESELASRPTRIFLLANFIDEVLRANARNWEEKRGFESAQELGVRWQAMIARQGPLTSGAASKQKPKPEPMGFKSQIKTLCRRFNEGRCDIKDDKHPAPYDPSVMLRHACSRYLTDKKRHCLENHPGIEHR